MIKFIKVHELENNYKRELFINVDTIIYMLKYGNLTTIKISYSQSAVVFNVIESIEDILKQIQ